MSALLAAISQSRGHLTESSHGGARILEMTWHGSIMTEPAMIDLSRKLIPMAADCGYTSVYSETFTPGTGFMQMTFIRIPS